MNHLTHDILDEKEEAELGYRTIAGCEQSREKLILHNLRLVCSIASRYKENTNVSIDDLEMAGIEGLIIAIDKWDPERARLSTYAVNWIESLIKEEIYRDVNIRIPLSNYNMFRSVYKRATELEIFDISDKSIRLLRKDKEVTKIMSGYNYNKKTIWQYYKEWFRFSNPNTVSLDEDIDIDNVGNSTMSLAEDTYSKSTEDYVEDKIFVEQLLNLAKLTEKERYVIEQQYLYNRTLKDIGSDLGVLEQRTQQISAVGIKKLKQVALNLSIDETENEIISDVCSFV